MRALDGLAACAGSWRGTNTLQDPTSNTAEEYSSSATVTPVLGGKFVRLDYTWSYRGGPQEGSLLIGFDEKEGQVTAHWIDSWHMSGKVMVCLGPRPDSTVLSVRGSYAAPPAPDWGWRFDITPDERTLRMVMFNIWPDGSREDLAAEASSTRA
jgi:hypothetical protein